MSSPEIHITRITKTQRKVCLSETDLLHILAAHFGFPIADTTIEEINHNSATETLILRCETTETDDEDS